MSLLLEYCNDINILTEAFYGKPKEFIEIEKRLEKIIDMIKDVKEYGASININATKEVQEVERLFTKFFKNKETSITFYASTLASAYNAFTLPSSLSYFKKDKSNKKLTRVDDLFINVNIDIGLVYGAEMTPGELMSFILHEIGHCFDASFFMLLTNINIDYIKYVENADVTINEIVNNGIIQTIISFLGRSYPIQKLYQVINRYASSDGYVSKFINDTLMIFTDILIFINIVDVWGYISSLMKDPTHTIVKLINPNNIFGYASEKFADSFATSYGYGKDLSSALNKVEQSKGLLFNENIKQIPLLNIGYDFNKVVLQASTLLFDPHPTNAARIQSQLNKLKRDLNDPNLNPKVKKELLANIKEIEDYIDNIVLNINDESNEGRFISYMWNYLIIKVFKGKIDIREFFEAIWSHEL